MKEYKISILVLLFTIIFFGLIDYTLSNTSNLFDVKKNCFKQTALNYLDKKYYHYSLSKNCFAIEKKGVSKSYSVFIDKDGFRVRNFDYKKAPTEKILFLGDSFTYGFGVNYEDSIPGVIESKTDNQYDIINFGVPGYSPLINLYNLKNFLTNNPKSKISKVFYILDLTDPHDESNRWQKVSNFEQPVLKINNVIEEIEPSFFKKNFRASRYLSYLINKFIRNLKYEIKNFNLKNEVDNSQSRKSFWASFTYTNMSQLKEDKDYNNLWINDLDYGLKNIEENLIEISKILKKYNSEFFIVIHPWKETIFYGQEAFNWEDFSAKLCEKTQCKKLINLFPDIKNESIENKNWATKFYFINDIHFNIFGNKVYAEKIYREAF